MIKRIGVVFFLLLLMTSVVQAQDAQILWFTVQTPSYIAGEPLSMNWKVAGTDVALLEVYDLAQPETPLYVIQLPIEGSGSIVIPETAVSGVRLVLWAANLPDFPVAVTMYEHLASMSMDLALAAPCTPQFYFTEADANACPGMEQARVGAAYQPFEDGFMLWREDTGDVWVMLKGGAVSVYAASIYGVYPDNPIPDVPPTGYSTPSSGFGKVWGTVKRVRDVLGWALGPEVGYDMIVQTAEPTVRLPYFYMTLPGEIVIKVERGRWTQETS